MSISIEYRGTAEIDGDEISPSVHCKLGSRVPSDEGLVGANGGAEGGASNWRSPKVLKNKEVTTKSFSPVSPNDVKSIKSVTCSK